MRDWLEDYGIPTALFAAAGLFLVLAVYGMAMEARGWAAFKEEHHCRVVGRMSGELLTSLTTNGQLAFTPTPDRTAWACDDGVTYWR